MSYIVIICPNLYEKLTKSEISQIGVGSKISQNHSSSISEVISAHYLPQIHMKSLPRSKLGQVGVGSNISQNHSSSL